MQVKNTSNREQIAYPLKSTNINQIKLPRLKAKKKVIHSKNPYKVKQLIYIDESKLPKKCLDGFLLLKVTKNDLPHEIIKCKLTKMNINQVNVEDTYFFINLVDLDISENNIHLEDLINFANLQQLIISANKIQNIHLSEQTNFKNLETLDLSFNNLTKESILTLSHIPKLRKLILESNDLTELPENMSAFTKLEELNLDSNLFESNSTASNFWFALASIKKLSILSLARNHLRGIHTERLVAGNFQNLHVIDFSYNAVENQHNLICSRNFRSLQKLVITGNPFAMIQEHKGLEMEVYARTGGIVINEEVEKYYLKQKNDKNRLKIKFDVIRKVENDDFKKQQRDYFMGIEMPQIITIKSDQQQQKNVYDEQNEQYESDNQDEQQPMFLTENPGNSIQKQQINNNLKQNTEENAQFHQSSQQNKLQIHKENIKYDQFIEIARDQLGDNKEYEEVFDLNTAYKTLKNMIKKPEDNINFQEPHYLKPTQTIQRYKFKDQSISLINAEQIENFERKKGISQSDDNLQNNEGNKNNNQSVKINNESDAIQDIGSLF